MLVREFQVLKESAFGKRFKRRVEERGTTPHAVAMEAGITPSNLYTMISGGRRPSDRDLEKLSAVKKFGTTLDELRAWRALDKVGAEDMDRIRRYVPEALTGAQNAELDAMVMSWEPTALPGGNQGGIEAEPLDEVEQEMLAKLPAHRIPPAGDSFWTLSREHRKVLLDHELEMADLERRANKGKKGG